MAQFPDLPDAELEVLACVQRQGKATAREIRELMHAYRPMAHASVLTLLTRLEAKDLVSREKGPFGKSLSLPADAPLQALGQQCDQTRPAAGVSR